MTNYASESDIEKRLGLTIDTNSRPTSDQLSAMLDDADALINQEAKTENNLDDRYNGLKQIAINLVMKMINNMYSFTSPEQFPYMEVELTPEEKRIIHKAYERFAGNTIEIGD